MEGLSATQGVTFLITTVKYVITSDTFVIDLMSKKIKKLENRGEPPSNRAAHASLWI